MTIRMSKTYFKIEPRECVNKRHVPLKRKRELRVVLAKHRKQRRYRTRELAECALANLPHDMHKHIEVCECFDILGLGF